MDRNYDNSDDIAIVLEEMKSPKQDYEASKPTALTAAGKQSSDYDELKIEYTYRLKKWVDRGDQIKVNMTKLFSLIVI